MFRSTILTMSDPREETLEGQELRHLAPIRLPIRYPQRELLRLALSCTIDPPQMVKEFRALSRAEAVEAMYQNMAAQHRARFRNVQILRAAEIEKEDVRRPYIKQLLEPGLKFPLPHRRTKSKAWYAANRPVSQTTQCDRVLADLSRLPGRKLFPSIQGVRLEECTTCRRCTWFMIINGPALHVCISVLHALNIL